MTTLVPNEQQPGWPTAPKPPRPKDDADAERFKAEMRTYERAVAAVQSTVPYQGCLGSENISFRQAVQELRARYAVTEPRDDGKVDRTIAWTGDSCPKVLGEVDFTVRYQDWRTDYLGRSRYAYLEVQVKSPPA